jgi:heme exporter protein D
MNWNSAAEFFAMGGYGLYVWASFGMAALLMTAEPWLARRRHRQALANAALQAVAQADPQADPDEDRP